MSGQEKGIKSTVSFGGQPVHALLVPFPIAFLLALPLSDLGFWWTGDPFWARASFWLAASGLVMGSAAAVFGRIDFLTIRRASETPQGYFHAGMGGLLLLLTIVNVWIRLDDAQISIVPWGLLLSLFGALLIVLGSWCGGELLFRHLIGVVGKKGRKG